MMTFNALMIAAEIRPAPGPKPQTPNPKPCSYGFRVSGLNSTYEAALLLVASIDEQLNRGIHYRRSDGRLLMQLDDVVRAILDDDLLIREN